MIKLNSIIEHNFTINNDFVVKIEKDEKSDLSCVSNYGQWKTKYGSFNCSFFTNEEEGCGSSL